MSMVWSSIVLREVVGAAISCTLISDRLISIRISARPHIVAIVGVYTLTSIYEDADYAFYDQVEKAIGAAPRKDIVIVKIDPDTY